MTKVIECISEVYIFQRNKKHYKHIYILKLNDDCDHNYVFKYINRVLVMMIFLFITTGDSDFYPRVFNGYPDINNKFSYVVCIERKIENSYMRYCTGSLIDENWVLTAGHCIGNNKTLSVSYGNRSQENTTNRVDVLLQIRHPDYRQYTSPNDHENSELLNDIGLLKVESIPVNNTGKIYFVDYMAFTGLSVIYAGYGITWREKPMTSAEFKEKFSKLNLTPLLLANGVTRDCNISITWHPIICVHSEISFSGTGDSGGPLLYDDTIVGVHSGHFDKVLVFVKVRLYLQWIRDVKAKYEP